MEQKKGAKRQGREVSRAKHDRSLQVLSNLLWFSRPFVFPLEVRYNFFNFQEKRKPIRILIEIALKL